MLKRVIYLTMQKSWKPGKYYRFQWLLILSQVLQFEQDVDQQKEAGF